MPQAANRVRGRLLLAIAPALLSCSSGEVPRAAAQPARDVTARSDRSVERLDIAIPDEARWVEFRSPTVLLVGRDRLGSARGIAEYDAATGKLRGVVVPAGDGRADWSPRSGRLAYAADRTVEVVRVSDGSPVRRFGDLWASSVALSPDGRLLAVSYAQPEAPPQIELFDVHSGAKLVSMAPRGDQSLPYDSGFRLLLDFTADGRRLAALLVNDVPQEAEVSLWSARGARQASWQVQGGIEEPGLAPSLGDALAIAPDGSAVAAGDIDAAVHLFPILGGKERLLRRSGRAVTAVAFSPDGSLLAAAGADGPLALWSYPDGRRIAVVPAPPACGSLAFSPDGARVAAGCDKAVAIWRIDRLRAGR
jgi:WD40 repeat protein